MRASRITLPVLGKVMLLTVFVFVQRKGIAIHVKAVVVLGPIARVAVSHRDYVGFTGEVSRRMPVAEALREVDRRAVGVFHREHLRNLTAIDTSGQQADCREGCVGKRDCGIGNNIGLIRNSEGKEGVVQVRDAVKSVAEYANP